MNEVSLIGRLGSDPDVKTLSNGQQVARVSLATTKKWTDKDGNKQEKTEWHKLVLWAQKAATAERYLKKGMEMFARGEIQTRSYDDSEGNKRFVTEIVVSNFRFFGSAPEKREALPNYAPGASDEIPF